MFTILGKVIYSSILIVIGIVLNRFFQDRPQLITYYGHVAAGRVRFSDESTIVNINTHSIVIANTGRKPALNVKVGHWPPAKNIQNMIAIYPPQPFKIETSSEGVEEILFERLLPKQSITVTYIYPGDLTFKQLTAYVRSEEAEAKFLPVSINRQYPLWVLNILRVLVFVGFVTVIYYAYIYGMISLVYLRLIN